MSYGTDNAAESNDRSIVARLSDGRKRYAPQRAACRVRIPCAPATCTYALTRSDAFGCGSVRVRSRRGLHVGNFCNFQGHAQVCVRVASVTGPSLPSWPHDTHSRSVASRAQGSAAHHVDHCRMIYNNVVAGANSVGRDFLGTRQESQERPYALPPAPLPVERRGDGVRRLGAGGSCSSHGSSV